MIAHGARRPYQSGARTTMMVALIGVLLVAGASGAVAEAICGRGASGSIATSISTGNRLGVTSLK